MKKLALFGATTVALGAAAWISGEPIGRAADHLDAPATSMASNRMADITDVYAWMSSDGSKVNLVMDVSPAEDGTHAFGPSVQYVFHVTSTAAYGTSGTEQDVICTFASNTSVQCWIAKGSPATTVDYVTGDPSATAGIANASGKMKVFAGKRSDPFFFNLAGFKTVVGLVEAAGQPQTNAAGCPLLPAATAAALRQTLQATQGSAVGPCPENQADCFANFNVMSIVLQIDKTELNLMTGQTLNTILSVWGSTHMAQ